MTRDQMETRRLQAAEDLRLGMSQGDVTRKHEVSRTTASRWNQAIIAGRDLKRHKAPGRPPRLDSQALAMLKNMCQNEEGPWTATELQGLIEDAFQITFDPNHCYRIMSLIGLPRKRDKRLSGNSSSVSEPSTSLVGGA